MYRSRLGRYDVSHPTYPQFNENNVPGPKMKSPPSWEMLPCFPICCGFFRGPCYRQTLDRLATFDRILEGEAMYERTQILDMTFPIKLLPR